MRKPTRPDTSSIAAVPPASPERPAARAKPPRARRASETAAEAAPAAAAPAGALSEDKPAKAKKPKLVRDSFTMPKTEYAAIDALKQRAIELGQPVKKSELLRAGLIALTALDAPGLAAALAKVPALKTGRPKQAAD